MQYLGKLVDSIIGRRRSPANADDTSAIRDARTQLNAILAASSSVEERVQAWTNALSSRETREIVISDLHRDPVVIETPIGSENIAHNDNGNNIDSEVIVEEPSDILETASDESGDEIEDAEIHISQIDLSSHASDIDAEVINSDVEHGYSSENEHVSSSDTVSDNEHVRESESDSESEHSSEGMITISANDSEDIEQLSELEDCETAAALSGSQLLNAALATPRSGEEAIAAWCQYHGLHEGTESSDDEEEDYTDAEEKEKQIESLWGNLHDDPLAARNTHRESDEMSDDASVTSKSASESGGESGSVSDSGSDSDSDSDALIPSSSGSSGCSDSSNSSLRNSTGATVPRSSQWPAIRNHFWLDQSGYVHDDSADSEDNPNDDSDDADESEDAGLPPQGSFFDGIRFSHNRSTKNAISSDDDNQQDPDIQTIAVRSYSSDGAIDYDSDIHTLEVHSSPRSRCRSHSYSRQYSIDDEDQEPSEEDATSPAVVYSCRGISYQTKANDSPKHYKYDNEGLLMRLVEEGRQKRHLHEDQNEGYEWPPQKKKHGSHHTFI